MYSPRLEKNIALAMVATEHAEIDTQAVVSSSTGERDCKVVPKPFYDPKKAIAVKT
ncbi:MAG: glycine cleavage T C-terminal barrel domain-containing protein [Pseudomonadota bacterium]